MIMNAVITVTGKDTVGIIAKISNLCADANANIRDITQKVFGDMFVMTMLIQIDGLNIKFADFVDKMNELGQKENLVIHTMHEDIFNAMHNI